MPITCCGSAALADRHRSRVRKTRPFGTDCAADGTARFLPASGRTHADAPRSGSSAGRYASHEHGARAVSRAFAPAHSTIGTSVRPGSDNRPRSARGGATRREPARLVREEHESLTRAALQVRPCHNDLNPWNVIVSAADPGRWCTLDWEIAGDNDPLFDLICVSEGLGWSLEETDKLIDEYLERMNPPAHQRPRNAAPFAKRTSCASMPGRWRNSHPAIAESRSRLNWRAAQRSAERDQRLSEVVTAIAARSSRSCGDPLTSR